MAITLRSDKGSALTIKELDDNFRHFTGSHAVTGSLVVSGSLVISGSISATSGISATGSLITASAVEESLGNSDVDRNKIQFALDASLGVACFEGGVGAPEESIIPCRFRLAGVGIVWL